MVNVNAEATPALTLTVADAIGPTTIVIPVDNTAQLELTVSSLEGSTNALVLLSAEAGGEIFFATSGEAGIAADVELMLEAGPPALTLTNSNTSGFLETPAITFSATSPTITVPGVYSQVSQAIRNRIGSFVETELAMPVVWPNENQNSVPAFGENIWCQVQISHRQTDMIGWGDRGGDGHLYRLSGEAALEFRVPVQSGDNALLTNIDSARAGFDPGPVGEGIGRVFYDPPYLANYGQDFDSADGTQWFRGDLILPWNATRAIAIDNDILGEQSRRTYNTLADAVRVRFGTLVEDVQDVTVVYDNSPTEPPNDEQWVHFTTKIGRGEVIEQGPTPNTRTPGVSRATILSPLGAGTADSLALAEAIVLRFLSVSDSRVFFDVPSVVTLGRRGQWWQTNVDLPFSFHEVT